MSKPVTPGWPEAGAFPFMPFPLPGTTASQTTPMAGLSGGIDLIKDFWSRLPGGAALPGFMVPTVDVEELDKRIGDLKAAERWIEVNLSMLRATIQGLEVQRHTIAAIQALTTPAAATPPPPGPAEHPTPQSPAAAPASNEWLDYLQAQFTKVAQTAMPPSAPSGETASRATVAKKAAPRARKTTKPR